MLTKVKTVAKKMFSKYLIVTNTIACGSLLALGDGITQHIEKRSYAKANNNIQPSSAWSYNWPRSGNILYIRSSLLLKICYIEVPSNYADNFTSKCIGFSFKSKSTNKNSI